MRTTRMGARLLLGALLIGGGVAQGALIDAGNGLINDTIQNLVWTQDANLAASNTFGLATGVDLGTYPTDSSGVHGRINANGAMNWPGAMLWINAMNDTNYKGYSDWRLVTITDSGKVGCDFAYTGTDCGFNVDTATGELASLWYDALGNLASYDSNGIGRQSGWGTTNTGPFTNMNVMSYWSGTEYAPYSSSQVWYFGFRGAQFTASKSDQVYGWAVRPGQVDVIPLPATGLLMALGLLALDVTRRGRWSALVIR